MKNFLEKLVSTIITDNVNLNIKVEENNGLNVYTIIVPTECTGKIIGKGGKVINAIRTLCRVKAIKQGKRVLVKVGEEIQKGFSLPTTAADSGEEISS